jgi:hypothetical protein
MRSPVVNATCIFVGITINLMPILPTTAQTPTDFQNGGSAPRQTSATASPSNTLELIRKWFQRYDVIRHEAQMTPTERQKADAMMSQGLSIIVPGEQKVESQQLLSSLVNRYHKASEELKALTFLPATSNLHRGYYQYFNDAGRLFSDYIKVQNNLLAVDDQGTSLASTLMSRKESLTGLEQNNKAMDAQLRQTYGIAPYPY